MDQRQQVIKEARSWIPTPFAHQGAVKGCGAGCGGFLIGVYSSVGIPVPTVEEMGHFSHDWHLHTREDRYLHILSKYAEPVDVPLPGDICLFHLGRVYGHSGIVIDWPEIIHAHHTGGVQTCNALQDPLTLGRKVMFLSPWGKA